MVAASRSQSDPEFVESLLAQRDRYSKERSDLLGEIQRLQGELARSEAGAKAVDELLRIEAPELAKREDTGMRNTVVELAAPYFDPDRPFLKAAHDILREVGSPIYYRELADRIRASGVVIPGKDPASNLYAHLRRHPRFARPTPGHFGLATEAPESVAAPSSPAPAKRRRKRRGHRRALAKRDK